MWYLRVFLLFLFVLVVLFFGLINRGQEIVLKGWDAETSGTTIDAVVALLIAFGLGAILFMAVALVRELRLRRRCSQLSRELSRVRRELDALRTAPLEGPIPDHEPARMRATDAAGNEGDRA
jgi:uncharacterized integral membrane protein